MKQHAAILHRDLRDPRDRTRFNPWAHFQVLAVMLFPEDRIQEKRFLAHTLLRQPNVNPFSQEEFGNLLNRSKTRGRQVGFLLCALCELYHQHRIVPTLEMAVAVIRGELADISWDNFSPELAPQHLPRSGRLLRELYKEFGAAGHLWAAVLVREQGLRHRAWIIGRIDSPELPLPPDLLQAEAKAFPTSLADLPDFLATANEIRKRFDEMPKMGTFTKQLRVAPYRFIVPVGIKLEHKLQVLPLPADRIDRIKVFKQEDQ